LNVLTVNAVKLGIDMPSYSPSALLFPFHRCPMPQKIAVAMRKEVADRGGWVTEASDRNGRGSL